ncbi:MAG: hypothetical protein NTY75_01155 [Candidatus Shapirobacteria bacterium]|nr:hypothetical protein [Candidatus Shapirobacteria bacterium]
MSNIEVWSDEEAEKIRQELFNYLIPQIQRHVNETGHIWNKVTSCHLCLSLRNDYQWKTKALLHNKYGVYTPTEIRLDPEIVEAERIRDEINRRLSD